MTLLLDQGLPRSTVFYLAEKGITSQHTGDCGLATAQDSTIIEHAREQKCVVVTLDSDFHTQLALSGAEKPSVIRIRMEGLRAESIARLIAEVRHACGKELEAGAMVSVTTSGIRIRHLPLLR